MNTYEYTENHRWIFLVCKAKHVKTQSKSYLNTSSNRHLLSTYNDKKSLKTELQDTKSHNPVNGGKLAIGRYEHMVLQVGLP